MKQWFIYIFLFVSSLSQAQSVFYSSNANISFDSLRTVIGKINLLDCSIEQLYIDTTIRTLGGYHEWLDIAYCADGELYGLGHDGIYSIDITAQAHTKILDGPSPPMHRWKKGMVCTKDTMLVFGERDILTYDPLGQTLFYNGRLPTPLSVWSNIFQINGMLLSSNNSNIVELNLLDPSISMVGCNLPISGFLSFTQVAISCDSTAIFGFDSGGDIYLFNPLDCSISYYCSIPVELNESFEGSEPAVMYMPPSPCAIHLDLDALDISLPGNDYRDTFACSLPNTIILSDPDLFSDKPWDSLLIWIEGMPPGFVLEGQNPLFAMLSGQHTSRLKLISTDNTDFSLLSDFINELSLLGDIPPGFTEIQVGFCGWADYLVTDTAYAYFTLIGRSTFAGEDQPISICMSDSSIILHDYLSSSATSGGEWSPPTVLFEEFQPSIDPTGTYHYIVNDPYCGPDSADFIIETFPVLHYDLGEDRLLCPGDTTQLRLNLPNIEILWSDGSTNETLDVSQPQIISVTLTDEHGCIYSDTINITFDDHCLIDELYIPNIFSPDGNGINDEWIIPEQPGFLSMIVSIYDRWGNILFHQEGSSIRWTGISTRGKEISTGVYAYRLVLTTTNNTTIVKVGDLTLLR